MTPVGIELGTFRFVAQRLNHCATAVPILPQGQGGGERAFQKSMLFRKWWTLDRKVLRNFVLFDSFINIVKEIPKYDSYQLLHLAPARSVFCDLSYCILISGI